MKLGWIEFWIGALACYRITVIISRDKIFKLARERAPGTFLKELLKCPFCISVYAGAFTAFALWTSGYREPPPVWFLLSLAFSAVTIALDRTFTSDYHT